MRFSLRSSRIAAVAFACVLSLISAAHAQTISSPEGVPLDPFLLDPFSLDFSSLDYCDVNQFFLSANRIANVCTRCESGYSPTEDGICRPSYPLSDPTLLHCPAGYFSTPSGYCQRSCPIGQFADGATCKPDPATSVCPVGQYIDNAIKECQKCDDSCLSCSGSAKSQCLSCPLGKTLFNGTCQEACLPGCKSCFSDIADPAANRCLKCADGFTLDLTGRCQFRAPAPSDATCLWNPSDPICRSTTTCPGGQYFDPLLKRCELNTLPPIPCTSGPSCSWDTTPSICPVGSIQVGGRCIPAPPSSTIVCPGGSFADPSGRCVIPTQSPLPAPAK